MACAVAVAATLIGISKESIAQAPAWVAERAALPRGTTYEIRKPNTWNGVLVNDLDFAASPDAPRYLWLVNHGYAVAGTARRADRTTNYDPAREIVDLINVAEIFEAKYGKPKRVIQLGQSGGGHVALAFAEQHPDRVDGVVATCAHTPVWLMNSELDAWFTLQQLIGPDLQIANFASANVADITAAWRKALTAAQQTPIGRARIALAVTVGQLPQWVSSTTPEPDTKDVVALQQSMYEHLLATAAQPGGQSRFMFERSAPGQLSWNTGVDYAKAFKRGDPDLQRATRKLYELAGANLNRDLARVNAADRIEADPKAVQWWSYPGRTVVGEPKVPTLRIHTNGDAAVPPSLVAGYDALVKANGYQALYRRAFVHGPGHCAFNPAEIAAAVETVMQRLDTGQWGSTSPAALNKLGSALDPTSVPRFYQYPQFEYSRIWIPSVKDYLGLHGENMLLDPLSLGTAPAQAAR